MPLRQPVLALIGRVGDSVRWGSGTYTVGGWDRAEKERGLGERGWSDGNGGCGGCSVGYPFE